MSDDAAVNRGHHVQTSDLQGASRLAVDATLALTRLVEHLHHDIVRTPRPVTRSSDRTTSGITGFVYSSIRGVTHLVGGGLDAVLGLATIMAGVGDEVGSPQREAALAILNGVIGDHLDATANPLAIPMRLRHDGRPIVLEADELRHRLHGPRRRVILFIHGLCMHPQQWRRHGHDHGTMLSGSGDATPLYLHYNSGLHISTNGRLLADQLQALLDAWPVPLDELIIVGHSAGGLVARSACHQGLARGDTWPQRLTKMVFLGTPHHGAPLERGGHWIDAILDAGRYTAAFSRLGKLRSAGITDLRHGSLLDADWSGHDRFAHGRDTRTVVPLPPGVTCYAVAGSASRRESGLRTSVMGDGLVPVDSALGRHADPARCLQFAPGHTWIGEGLHHLDLLDAESVRTRLQSWLAPKGPTRRARRP